MIRIDPVKFFNSDPISVAQAILGHILCHKVNGIWLCARIIETEAYKLEDKGSHASLGFTEKRKALFMSPGTIYMYYSRGSDSFGTSCKGHGNTVLMKSAFTIHSQHSKELKLMQKLNPIGNRVRDIDKQCSGQTLLCKSLGLKVTDWNAKQYINGKLELRSDEYKPQKIIQTTRLGIRKGRDENLPYRFLDSNFINSCTQKPNPSNYNIINLD